MTSFPAFSECLFKQSVCLNNKKLPCIFLFTIIDTSGLLTVCTNNGEKQEMTSSISSPVRMWKICHSGPGCTSSLERSL